MMKKTKSLLLAVAMCLTMLAGATTIVMAEEQQIKVTLNGKAIEFDQPPTIVNGSTLVPMRAIFEAMGATVEWDAEKQMITARIITGDDSFIRNAEIGKKIIITIGEDTYKYGNIYGKNAHIAPGLGSRTLDTPATIVNGRTLVPVRAIAESFGADVEWDSKTQTVIITTTIHNNEIAQPTQSTYYAEWPTVLDFGTFTGATLVGKEVGAFGFYYYANGTFTETGETSLEAYMAALIQEGFEPKKAVEGSSTKIFGGKGGIIIQIKPGEIELEINMQRY